MPAPTTATFDDLADGDPVTLRFEPMSGGGRAHDRPYRFQSQTPGELALALGVRTGRLDYFFWDIGHQCWTADQGATRVSVVQGESGD
jgi:hypothetical protein